MAEETLGCYNIFDLRDIAFKRVPEGLFEIVDRVLALLGCRDASDIGPESLHVEDGLFRTASVPRANIRLVESAKVAAR